LWLAMPLIIGSMAVAEEHKLGTMESQCVCRFQAVFNSSSNFLCTDFGRIG